MTATRGDYVVIVEFAESPDIAHASAMAHNALLSCLSNENPLWWHHLQTVWILLDVPHGAAGVGDKLTGVRGVQKFLVLPIRRGADLQGLLPTSAGQWLRMYLRTEPRHGA